MGDGARASVVEIGFVSLFLPSKHILILKYVVYVTSIRRNFISISNLDECVYSFVFGNGKLDICVNSAIVGSGILRDGLYMLM